MYSEFQPILLTLEDRNALLEEMSLLSQIAFFTDPDKKKETLNNTVRPQSLQIWTEFLEKNTLTPQDWQVWKKEVQNLPVIELSLAFPVKPNFIAEIIRLIRQSPESGNAILSLKSVPQLMGGVHFTLNGKFFDYSLHRKVQEYFLHNSDKIRQVLFAP